MGQKEATARRHFVKEEKFLILPKFSMVPKLGFLEKFLVLLHLLGVWEGDAVDALKGVVLGVSEEIRRRVLI